MRQRSIITSGGSDHIHLVKLASKRAIDEFDGLQEILIQYERTDINAEIKLSKKWYHRTGVSYEMRPDIMVLTGVLEKGGEYGGRYVETRKTIVIEVETNPMTLFKNTFKIEAYKKIKKGGRIMIDEDPAVMFILVCFEDAKLPKNTSPFTEIWKFEREMKNENE